jgi:hypothetical protein
MNNTNLSEANLIKFLAEDAELLEKVILGTSHYHEKDIEVMMHVVDNHYSNMIRKIELKQELTKLDFTKKEYVASHEEGISLEILAKALALEVSDKLIKLMRDEIYHYFNERSILVDVSFKFPYFILDFTVEDDDLTSGKVINLKLEDIISNMIAYKLEFDDAMISVLTYETLQV